MRFLLRVALCLFLLAPAGPALALPPVWIVRDHDSTMTLFGSVHLLPKGVAWRPPELERAMASAEEVWFETPMDSDGQSEAMKAAQENAFLPEGQSLRALLSPRGRELLDKVVAELRLEAYPIDRLQPWYAELLISAALYRELGAEAPEGVEQQLWSKIPDTAKRRALESPSEQVGFFAKAPMKDQVAALEQALRQAGDAEKEFRTLLKAWLSGDLKRLDKEVVRPLKKSAPGLYENVVVQRNTRWMEAIEERLKGSGDTVVVVGMGHLIGPQGLPQQLRARGFEVEGP